MVGLVIYKDETVKKPYQAKRSKISIVLATKNEAGKGERLDFFITGLSVEDISEDIG